MEISNKLKKFVIILKNNLNLNKINKKKMNVEIFKKINKGNNLSKLFHQLVEKFFLLGNNKNENHYLFENDIPYINHFLEHMEINKVFYGVIPIDIINKSIRIDIKALEVPCDNILYFNLVIIGKNVLSDLFIDSKKSIEKKTYQELNSIYNSIQVMCAREINNKLLIEKKKLLEKIKTFEITINNKYEYKPFGIIGGNKFKIEFLDYSISIMKNILKNYQKFPSKTNYLYCNYVTNILKKMLNEITQINEMNKEIIIFFVDNILSRINQKVLFTTMLCLKVKSTLLYKYLYKYFLFDELILNFSIDHLILNLQIFDKSILVYQCEINNVMNNSLILLSIEEEEAEAQQIGEDLLSLDNENVETKIYLTINLVNQNVTKIISLSHNYNSFYCVQFSEHYSLFFINDIYSHYVDHQLSQCSLFNYYDNKFNKSQDRIYKAIFNII